VREREREREISGFRPSLQLTLDCLLFTLTVAVADDMAEQLQLAPYPCPLLLPPTPPQIASASEMQTTANSFKYLPFFLLFSVCNDSYRYRYWLHGKSIFYLLALCVSTIVSAGMWHDSRLDSRVSAAAAASLVALARAYPDSQESVGDWA